MTINVSLNPGAIDAAIKRLEEYAKKVDGLPDTLVKELAADGARDAQDMAQFMDAYDTGELVGSIRADVQGRSATISANADHAAYVEFGTGVVGENAPAPHAPIHGWEYDVNSHGEKGWWYVGDDGKRHWTKGMPSRPFMYDTAQMMRQAVPQRVEEALKKE